MNPTLKKQQRKDKTNHLVIGYEWILLKIDGIGIWKFSAIKHLDEVRVHVSYVSCVSYVSLAVKRTQEGEEECFQ